MTIGTGIVLLVIGAILVFAVNVDVEYVNLDLIGYILMIAGGVVVLLGLIFMMTRRGRNDLPLERAPRRICRIVLKRCGVSV